MPVFICLVLPLYMCVSPCELHCRKGLYPAFGKRSVINVLVCVCLCSPGEMGRQHDSIRGDAVLGFPELFRVDSFIFFFLPHPFSLTHISLFVSLPSSPVSLPRCTNSALFLHAISSFSISVCLLSRLSLSFSLFLFLYLSLSPPDNDRAKECQSNGRRFSPGQDAGRTRSPFAR